MATASSLSQQGAVSMLDKPYKWALAILCNVDNGQVPSWERICLSLVFPSYPRGVKKSQTINPLTLAPACWTGWMVQPACPNLCAGDLHAGFCLRGRSPSSAPPEPVWLLTTPQRPRAHLPTAVTWTPTITFKILQAKISSLQPHMYPPARNQGNLGWGWDVGYNTG